MAIASMPVATDLAWLGTGPQPLALRLTRAGHGLRVWGDAPVSALPATVDVFETGSQAAVGTLVVFLGAGPADVLARACAAAVEGAVAVDLGQRPAAEAAMLAAALAQCGIDLVDAPLDAADVPATGPWRLAAGGTPRALARVGPVLASAGAQMVAAGGPGAGRVVRGCRDLVHAVMLETVAEGLSLAADNGVPVGPVREALLGGFAWSRALEEAGARVVGRRFEAGGARALRRGLETVLEQAGACGLVLPQAALVLQHLRALTARAGDDADPAALVRVIEAAGGRCREDRS